MKGKYHWIIDDFRAAQNILTNRHCYVDSPVFLVTHGANVLSFNLRLFRNRDQYNLTPGFKCQLMSRNKVKVFISTEFRLCDSDKQGDIHGERDLVQTPSTSGGHEQRAPRILPAGDHLVLSDISNKLNTLDPRGCNPTPEKTCFILFYEVFFEDQQSSEADCRNPEEHSLVSHLTRCLESSPDLHHSDVTLLCGGASIPCHKFVLSARSDVFAAMFSQPFRETNENTVNLTDADPDSIKSFVRFLYTDNTDHIKTFEEASSLLILSEKYNVKRLKLSCENILLGLVTLDNIVEIAYLVNLPILDNPVIC